MLQKFALLAAGGAAGTVLRYLASGWAQRLAGAGFPLGTFTVNMVGCLLFGAVWGFLEQRVAAGAGVRILVLTGFMGAFTTFSTYMFETVSLARAGQLAWAALNVAGQSAAGFVLVLAGLALGRLM